MTTLMMQLRALPLTAAQGDAALNDERAFQCLDRVLLLQKASRLQF
jgi:hypothetical protein